MKERLSEAHKKKLEELYINPIKGSKVIEIQDEIMCGREYNKAFLVDSWHFSLELVPTLYLHHSI